MCSIFGFQRQEDTDPSTIFFNSMRHRGPDHESNLTIDQWYLGHQRLSIIDTSAAGNQPMVKDGNVLVLNGEIYNYKELKNLFLKDHPQQSSSDTEVLLDLLNEKGIASLNHLNGMFAFAWYDAKHKDLYLCRDRFGVKPLHWSILHGKIHFSSEMRPLLKLKGACEFEPSVLESFMEDTATDFDERTFIRGIQQIKPGYYLRINSEGKIREERWYTGRDFRFDRAILDDYQGSVNFFEDTLTDSIKLRHRSDVPVCITLSGGLDSTSIYTLAKEKLNSQIKPFFFSHPGSPADESSVVLRLVEDYNDRVCMIQEDPAVRVKYFAESLKATEFPIWDPSASTYLQMYKAIRDSGFTVVLEGHGSDEQLGGYTYMIRAAIRTALAQGDFLNAWSLFRVFKATQVSAYGELSRNPLRNLAQDMKVLLSACRPMKKDSVKNFQKVLEDSFQYKILPIVLRAFDRLTMSQSIESRCPFMDFRIVEFTRALPLHLKVNSIGSKAILRELLKKYKKSYVFEKKQKLGFGSDLMNFFADPVIHKQFQQSIESSQLRNFTNLRRRAEKNIAKTKSEWGDFEPIWKIASLEMTRQNYLQDSGVVING
jgi:asparagine synthase (glutamine-hydrolysing)